MHRRKVRRYLTVMKTTVSSKGQIVIPAELRAQDKITAGEQFEVERIKPGEYLLRKVRTPGKPGLLKLLLNCPEKDWVQEVSSESTDEIGRDMREGRP